MVFTALMFRMLSEIEGIGTVSNLGFWFKVKAAVRFEPEEYSCISRIET